MGGGITAVLGQWQIDGIESAPVIRDGLGFFYCGDPA
jgi:hypothetical protein